MNYNNCNFYFLEKLDDCLPYKKHGVQFKHVNNI